MLRTLKAGKTSLISSHLGFPDSATCSSLLLFFLCPSHFPSLLSSNILSHFLEWIVDVHSRNAQRQQKVFYWPHRMFLTR